MAGPPLESTPSPSRAAARSRNCWRERRRNGPRWRQVNHPSPRGADVPMRYATMQLGGDGRHRRRRPRPALDGRAAAAPRRRAAVDGARICAHPSRRDALPPAVPARLRGRSDRRCRDREDRRRQSGRESCCSACRPSASSGQSFAEALRPRQRAAVAVPARPPSASPDGWTTFMPGSRRARSSLLSASLFRQENTSHFLVRLSPVRVRAPGASARAAGAAAGRRERCPKVSLSPTLTRILTANAAFLDIAQLATEEQARGEALDRWLGRPGRRHRRPVLQPARARLRAPVPDRPARRVRLHRGCRGRRGRR